MFATTFSSSALSIATKTLAHFRRGFIMSLRLPYVCVRGAKVTIFRFFDCSYSSHTICSLRAALLRAHSSSDIMKCLLFALLPATALALTCANKQTAISGGYRSTQQQNGATCNANKWCMKIRVDSGEGESSKLILVTSWH